jgi:hypothetical protein
VRRITHACLACCPVLIAGVFGIALLGAPVAASAASASAASPTSAALGQSMAPVSLSQVEHAVNNLYRDHPGIGAFVAQDVTYTKDSLGVVLRACTAGGPTTNSQVQSGRLLACAPLIFFLYTYGEKDDAPQATQAAQELFSYAVTNVVGPLDSYTVLGAVLRGWGLPVAPDEAAQGGAGPSQPNTKAEKSFVAAADKAILARGSVHIEVKGYRAGSSTVAETIAGDIGTTTATESLKSATSSAATMALAAIRVTPASAYFSGNPAGLTELLGISSKAAKRAGSRWVEMKVGTSEYKNFASEDTISALPASILPTSANSVKMKSTRVDGRQLVVLTWGANVGGTTSAPLIETLVVPATSAPLPLSETTMVGGNTQTATFTRWGEHFSVPVPPSSQTVTYSWANA